MRASLHAAAVIACRPPAWTVDWLAHRDQGRMTAGTMDPNRKRQAEQAQGLAAQAVTFGVGGGLLCGVPLVLVVARASSEPLLALVGTLSLGRGRRSEFQAGCRSPAPRRVLLTEPPSPRPGDARMYSLGVVEEGALAHLAVATLPRSFLVSMGGRIDVLVQVLLPRGPRPEKPSRAEPGPALLVVPAGV
jgi:hypothetical protein